MESTDKKIEHKMNTWAEKVEIADKLDTELYLKYDVKRGLRNSNGNGVLAGLTNISDVQAKKVIFGQESDDEGHLFYRGHEIRTLLRGFIDENRYGFEEATYLLLFGELPNEKELREFSNQLLEYRKLPKNFVRDVIMKAPSTDMMNSLQRSVLTLYSYDKNPDDVSLPNVLRQSMQLISQLPMLAIYAYKVYSHYKLGDSLIIHNPLESGSIAENILHMLHPDGKYTELEAKVLDIALVLHMDHGGGNNSAFTTHVVTSTRTDTYSSVIAALASLKGPLHGGANIRVIKMMDDMKEKITDWKDEEAIKDYLGKLMRGEAFDRAGVIYGVGHAVYSISDPRAEIFEEYVKKLSVDKGCEDEYNLYAAVARLAPELISASRETHKGVCVNVDFYSGFVYRMLGLPVELFTPLFAMARIVGWSAHRMEELANNGKIIRPAYQGIYDVKDYVKLSDR